ncbi:MAG: cob(I)yrinic acid a,c-diamide adenosyltransferase [Fibrobacterota bacterium]|nr:cob(I)yrinic acid a,c-diamide adenosyltransferase [Fibrobacterota bacterium]
MAININRVYTRGGDGGQTSLVGGARVEKDCRKLETYGTVDELICLVGTARTVIAAAPATPTTPATKREALTSTVKSGLESSLRRVQNRLFDMGSILATPAGQTYGGMPEITDADAVGLEAEMDHMQKSLEPLKSFVLPGGTFANAALHQCRAVCRRAEREIIRLSREEAVDNRLIKYINRLSDYFFVMSRYVSRKAGAKEYLWEFGLGASKAAAQVAGKPQAKAVSKTIPIAKAARAAARLSGKQKQKR